jgi:hypothetical protein
LAAAALAAVATVVAGSLPARADTTTVQRSATVQWVRVGALPEASGNVHIGRLQAWVIPGHRDVDSVYGETLDYLCPEGYVPGGLWTEAQTELDLHCTLVDNLVIESGDLQLHVQGRLHRAWLDGEVRFLHGLEAQPPGTLAVHLQWEAPGPKDVSRQLVGSRPRIIQVTTTRQASVAGTIGTAEVGSDPATGAGFVERYATIFRS